eukprot:52334_1
MAMTYYPLKKYLILKYDNQYSKRIYKGIASNSPRMLPNKSSQLVLKLEDICLTMFGLDLLMKFLEKEYSRENLLFIIEITLLQRSIYQHIEHNKRLYIAHNIDLNKMANCIFILPSICPKSTIVDEGYDNIIENYNNNNNNNMILSYKQRE